MANRTLGKRIMVGIRGAEPGDAALEEDLSICAAYGFCGVVLFDRDTVTGGTRNVHTKSQLKRLTAHIRERLGQDVVIAVDQEGGRVVRFRQEHGFTALPTAAEVAVLPTVQQRAIAETMARELAEVGINMNFAPCVDLDGPCPVIGGLGRSYGSDPTSIASSAQIMVEALDNAGITACAKHFPGHGSAFVDSHETLPDITETWAEEMELAPYKELLATQTLPAVMTAHVLHRCLDTKRPASLSSVTTGLLREKLGFTGMIVTDSIDMGALRQHWSLVECVGLAINAGADVVLHACNSPLGETAADVGWAIDLL